MARRPLKVPCDETTLKELKRISNSQVEPHSLIRRSRIILRCISGNAIESISEELNEDQSVIIKWRTRFLEMGIAGLSDKQRSGAPKTYGEEERKLILDTLGTPPPHGLAKWDGSELAKATSIPDYTVWRILRKEGICLARQRTWCISTDPEFASKAADVVGLYLAPSANAFVLSIDEKPGIQAISRKVGYVYSSNGKIVRGIKSTYKRNGTSNLFAALEVATGFIHAKTSARKTKEDFIGFLDDLMNELPQNNDIEYHIIMDNQSIHKNLYNWCLLHPNVFFHYTPTSASWLNMVEIWFNIFTRKVLKDASFDSVTHLCQCIDKYIEYYNNSPEPFVWRKREVRGAQIANTLSNLCN